MDGCFNLHLERRFEDSEERGQLEGERDLGSEAMMGLTGGCISPADV